MEEEHRIWHDIDHELTSNLLSKISLSTECSICSDTMNIPYTLECGHTFCYECLKNWFKNKLNCPSCRFDIMHKPVLNISLKEIIKNIQDLKLDVLVSIDNPKVIEERARILHHREDQLKNYELDKESQSLFDSLFTNSSVTLIDNSDGVPRCGNCHWEAHGPICNHCGFRIRGNRNNRELYYDSMEGEDFDFDGDDDGDRDLEDDDSIVLDHNNEDYDSDDSFVDTRPISEVMQDQRSDDGLLSTDDSSDNDEDTVHTAMLQDHSHHHQNSEDDDWQGFESPTTSDADVDHEHRHVDHEHEDVHEHSMHNTHDEPIELSDDNDDVQSREYYDSEDLRDALDQFHESDLHTISSDDDEPRIVIRRTRANPRGVQRPRRREITSDDD
ncbi:associated with histones/Spt16/Pob3 [Scheffersomyces amazonensis]|uniref:associated with histones/Spt16/Pob3 n=1 Tax=Scheffersomyces amazonensis TaxID=1078765 RepID=UPI00315D75C8